MMLQQCCLVLLVVSVAWGQTEQPQQGVEESTEFNKNSTVDDMASLTGEAAWAEYTVAESKYIAEYRRRVAAVRERQLQQNKNSSVDDIEPTSADLLKNASPQDFRTTTSTSSPPITDNATKHTTTSQPVFQRRIAANRERQLQRNPINFPSTQRHPNSTLLTSRNRPNTARRPNDQMRNAVLSLSQRMYQMDQRLRKLGDSNTARQQQLGQLQGSLARLQSSSEDCTSSLATLSQALLDRDRGTDFEMEKLRDNTDQIKGTLTELSDQGMRIFHAMIQSSSSSDRRAQSQSDLDSRIGDLAHMQELSALRIIKVQEELQGITTLITRNMNTILENVAAKEGVRTSPDGSALRSPVVCSPPAPTEPSSRPPSVPLYQAAEYPIDCWEVKQNAAFREQSIYLIKPIGSPKPFFVHCDMGTDGGGWTVIQNRNDGWVSFQKPWADYKRGFGNIAGNFWLGNDHIHQLSNQHLVELRIELSDASGDFVFASYSSFAIGSESEDYALKILGSYLGTAGDALSENAGFAWSTFDVDLDPMDHYGCARRHLGAWWYNQNECGTSNLNGNYFPDEQHAILFGMSWGNHSRTNDNPLQRTTMMIRRVGKEVQFPSSTGELQANPNRLIHQDHFADPNHPRLPEFLESLSLADWDNVFIERRPEPELSSGNKEAQAQFDPNEGPIAVIDG